MSEFSTSSHRCVNKLFPGDSCLPTPPKHGGSGREDAGNKRGGELCIGSSEGHTEVPASELAWRLVCPGLTVDIRSYTGIHSQIHLLFSEIGISRTGNQKKTVNLKRYRGQL